MARTFGQVVGCLHVFWNWSATGFNARLRQYSLFHCEYGHQTRTVGVYLMIPLDSYDHGGKKLRRSVATVTELAVSEPLCISARDTTFLTPTSAQA